MDQERSWELDHVDLEIPPIDGDDGGHDFEPPRTGGHGGRPGRAFPDPFLHRWWGVALPVLLLVVFGGQSLFVLQLSRSGVRSEAVAWFVIGLFVASFTLVFLAGAHFIERHRYR
ncbi:MAG: hypothetical protein EA397_17280 [Deltaproteobacteria bacterium]|nr:MAG: hypothetical protein EA397_17280 [Deltaproteobacteria bacterium]